MIGLSSKDLFWLRLLLLGAGVAVILYNAWSYCCGRCSVQTFCTLGWSGLWLLGLMVPALAALLGVRLYNGRRLRKMRCGCGRQADADWLFCPDCGRDRGRP